MITAKQLIRAGVLLAIVPRLVADPLGTAFVYQGRLSSGATPASGQYDLFLNVYDAPTNGILLANVLTNGVTVTNGLFAVSPDFGPDVFQGEARWMEISVRTNGSSTFTTLLPRQPISPSPYARFSTLSGTALGVAAEGVGTAALTPGAVDSTRLAGGAVTPASLGYTVASNTFWRLGGNAGTTVASFVGTLDNQPLEFRVNAVRVLRMEAGGAPSLTAGPNNSVASAGSTVAGGTGSAIQQGATNSFLGGGFQNVIQTNSILCFAGGGTGNSIQTSSGFSFLGGGAQNTILPRSTHAFLGGGKSNTIGSDTLAAFLGGGVSNSIAGTASFSVISGGHHNTNGASCATVPGGANNLAGGSYSFAAGLRAKATNQGAFVWADSTDADFASTGSNQFLLRAGGGVGVNTNNPNGAALNVSGIVRASSFEGSTATLASLNSLTITGTVSGNGSALTALNASQLTSGVVPDARLSGTIARLSQVWSLTGNPGTTAGVNFLGTTDAQPLEFRAGNVRALRLEPGNDGSPNVLGGSTNNTIDSGVRGAFIGGGGYFDYSSRGNQISESFGVIVGGYENRICKQAHDSFIGGGNNNVVSTNAGYSFIGGGSGNQIGTNSPSGVIIGGENNAIDANCSDAFIGGGMGQFIGQRSTAAFIGGGHSQSIGSNSFDAVICGGWNNTVESDAFASFIGSGRDNTILKDGGLGFIGGGFCNTNGGNSAMVPGGQYNTATGTCSFAAGFHARALHAGSFVWADYNGTDIATTGNNQFIVRASGGVGVGAAPQDAMLDVEGPARINDNDLYLRGGSDRFHGLGWYGSAKPFGTQTPDGPALYGWGGGVLGTTQGGTNWTLAWLANGNASVRGTLNQGSNRESKTGFATVNAREILSKVVALPVSTWRYKTESEEIRHLGPVSQDFHTAFGLGADDKTIATIDEGGVALAAIQGLNEVIKEKDARIQSLEKDMAGLKALVQAMQEKMVQRP